MRRTNFGISYFLLVIIQLLICNYLQFTPFISFTILPAMIMCLPLSINTPIAMLIAFGTGLTIDWLAEGLIGINAVALIPVAFARKTIIRLILGDDIVSREDNFSFKKNGIEKVAAITAIAYVIFLMVYIHFDGAGTRPFWFNLVRFNLSMLFSMILGLIVVGRLSQDDRK